MNDFMKKGGCAILIALAAVLISSYALYLNLN